MRFHARIDICLVESAVPNEELVSVLEAWMWIEFKVLTVVDPDVDREHSGTAVSPGSMSADVTK